MRCTDSKPISSATSLFVLLAAGLLAGCAEQRIRDESQRALGAGDYEHSVQALEAGVRAHPDSITLRKDLIQYRADVLTRLVSQAAGERAAGHFDEAQATLERAQRLDMRNHRLAALIADLRVERRQEAALQDAQKLLDAQRPESALRLIAQALKDNPRHEALVALQRSIEADLRQRQLRAATAVLAESRPISLDFRETSLRTVLDVVSRNSGINFVLDKDIRPDTRITVYMKQARVEDALDLIVGTNQLAKKVLDAKTIVVYPSTPDKQREYQEQVVRVFYLANSEVKGAAAFLKAMLKVRDPFIDERSNMLGLRESPENIELAERLIALYDTDEPEVLLEVEVMEVGATRLTDLGISYPATLSLTPLAPSGSSSVGGLTVSNLNHLAWNRVGVGISGLIINLKREVGDFTTLANPKIRARNREKAKVLVGDKIPIVTSTSSNTGFVSESVSYLDVGIKLEVEPTVYTNDDVAIKVGLEVSSIGSAVKTASGTLAYNIGTRNANTVLRLRDGETQLLAGLISREERTSSSRIPGLGDLPVLGRLFSNQGDNHKRTELILAITPRVLRNARRADASETELWVGTEAFQRLKPVGGGRFTAAPTEVGENTGEPARGWPSTSKEQPPGPPVSVSLTGADSVTVGDVFDVKLNLKSTATLRGLPFEVQFPPGQLQLVDVAEGEYFRRDGSATGVAKSGEAREGRVSVGVLRRDATGASGEGTVMLLKFKATAAGLADIRLISVNPIGLDSQVAAPALPVPLRIQVR